MSDLVEKWRTESEHRASIKRLGMKDMLVEVERLTAEVVRVSLFNERLIAEVERLTGLELAIKHAGGVEFKIIEQQERIAELEAMLGRWSVYEYLSDDYKTRLRRDSAALKDTEVTGQCSECGGRSGGHTLNCSESTRVEKGLKNTEVETDE